MVDCFLICIRRSTRAVLESQMGSGNSSMNSENEHEALLVKIGGKKNAQILGFEMLAKANAKKNSENFDLLRILIDRYHVCKDGVDFINFAKI